MKSIAITAYQHAELVDAAPRPETLQPNEVYGRTLVSLVSPGTELNWAFLGSKFPIYPGYACVFEITEVGAEVKDLKVGDAVFASGGHRSWQSSKACDVVKLPPGLQPEVGVFARLMGVSMSTLNTTEVRPPERVLITGLGPVGNLAAQIFSRCGYQVTGLDPVAVRCDLAAACGIRDVRQSWDKMADLNGQIGLHVECSGHEQAALEGCRIVRKRGEVVLVGVPWQKRTELSAFDLLHAVFHRYVILRSGWEWEVPRQRADYGGCSLTDNYQAAIRWLAEGSIRTEGLATGYQITQAQEVYSGLLAQTLPTPAAYFDWR